MTVRDLNKALVNVDPNTEVIVEAEKNIHFDIADTVLSTEPAYRFYLKVGSKSIPLN